MAHQQDRAVNAGIVGASLNGSTRAEREMNAAGSDVVRQSTKVQRLIESINLLSVAVNDISVLYLRVCGSNSEEDLPPPEAQESMESMRDLLEFGPVHLTRYRDNIQHITAQISEELY